MPRRYTDYAHSDRLWARWTAAMFHQDVGDIEGCPVHDQPAALARWFRPPGKLLFLGCGTGVEVGVANELGFEATGVTLHEDSVAEAVRNGRNVIRADAHFLPPEWEGGFDGVLSFHVAEHSPAPLFLMQECHRVLKPGGRTYHEVPEETNGMDDSVLVHLLVPTQVQARALLLKAGFQDITVGANPATPGAFFTGIK